MFSQKLLLLPELSGTAITGIYTESVKIRNVSHSCNTSTVEAVNKEFISNGGYESQPNKGVSRIVAKCLTASWSDVRNCNYLVLDCCDRICRTKRS